MAGRLRSGWRGECLGSGDWRSVHPQHPALRRTSGGAQVSLVCACVTRGGALWLCTPCHPTMSHLASSHRMQKSSLARPERRAYRPSPKDVRFWAPVMYIVGRQHRFESLRDEQSSGFGYVALASPGWCKVNSVLACLSAGPIGVHYVWGISIQWTHLPSSGYPTARN